jgi:hypothetical protein
MLGHITIAVTLDTYSHVALALHQPVAAQLQELLARARPPHPGQQSSGGVIPV